MQPDWSYCRECNYAPEAPAVAPQEAEPSAAAPDPLTGAAPAAAPGFGPSPAATPVPPAGFDAPAPAPGFDAPAPGYGSPATDLDAPAPGPDVPAPGFDVPAPGFESPAPGFDAPAPGFGSPATGFEAPAPSSFGFEAPAPSAFEAPAPSSFNAPPPPASPDPFGSGSGAAPGFAAAGFSGGPSSGASGGWSDDSTESFDPNAFDPDALAGTPYEEPEPEAPAAIEPPVPFDRVSSGAPAGGPGGGPGGAPGLPPGFEPAGPRPPGVPSSVGGGSSPFSVNRVVAVVAVIVGAIVLIGGIVLLTGGSKDNVSTTAAPGKTTPPPLGALPVSTSSVVDPLAPVSTTAAPPGSQRECDTIAIMHSADGSDYTPCGAGFKINFPGRPDTHSYDADLSTGRVTFQVHSSTNPDPKSPVRFEAGWGTLPKEPTPDEATEAMGALTAKMGCSLTAPTTFQGQPAYTCKGAGSGEPDPAHPTVATGIAFVRGTHVYALLATAYEASPKQLDAFGATFTQM